MLWGLVNCMQSMCLVVQDSSVRRGAGGLSVLFPESSPPPTPAPVPPPPVRSKPFSERSKLTS